MSIYKDGMRSTVGARYLFYNILLCITKNEINSNFYPVEYTALTLINGYFLEIVKYDKELLNIVQYKIRYKSLIIFIPYYQFTIKNNK